MFLEIITCNVINNDFCHISGTVSGRSIICRTLRDLKIVRCGKTDTFERQSSSLRFLFSPDYVVKRTLLKDKAHY